MNLLLNTKSRAINMRENIPPQQNIAPSLGIETHQQPWGQTLSLQWNRRDCMINNLPLYLKLSCFLQVENRSSLPNRRCHRLHTTLKAAWLSTGSQTRQLRTASSGGPGITASP
ncbi:hypothetical protein V6N13_099639 [Hibiscus sabdariffa]|uniref:Uncharacterized protein n=1 Tax=Hibiscus sabdariffa TaxID=183260 RepID=A0ABR2Q0B1_9ROSI